VSPASPASVALEPAAPVAFAVPEAHTPLPPTPGAEERSSSVHIVPGVAAADTVSAAAVLESADIPS